MARSSFPFTLRLTPDERATLERAAAIERERRCEKLGLVGFRFGTPELGWFIRHAALERAKVLLAGGKNKLELGNTDQVRKTKKGGA